MKKYGIGVIGMGWMGEAHSSAYKNYAIKFANTKIRPELIICSEILEKRAKTAKEKFGFKEYTTSYKELIQHPQVDIVDITAPNSLHLELIKLCIENGKHINCEKPVGAFPEETIKAYKLSKNSKKHTFVGFNYRWAPLVQYAKELISNGKLGRIYHYKGSFFPAMLLMSLGAIRGGLKRKMGLGQLVICLAIA